MFQVSQHCTSIQVVNLSHCHAITDISVSNLFMRCPKLHSLDLDRCVGLTDDALKNPGSSLQHLNLRLCVLITDLTLQSLSSLRLQTLNLHSTLVRNPLDPPKRLHKRIIDGTSRMTAHEFSVGRSPTLECTI